MPYRPLVDNTGSSRDARQYAMAPWATYSPSWTSGGSAPTLSNGTTVGGYRREGTTVHLRGQLIVGSTSTVGTGEFRLSLPPGATTIAGQYQVISAFVYDDSGGTLYRGIGVGEPSKAYLTFQMTDAGARFATSSLGANDSVSFGGTIEVIP